MYPYRKESLALLVSFQKSSLFSMDISINIEMIPTKDSQNEQWDSFEHAATYSYARSILEKKPVTTSEETSSKATIIVETSDKATTTAETSNKATTTIEYDCRLFC